MKVTEITINKKIQEKQYEPIELALTASLEENENASKSIDDLRFFIDYKLNEENRNHKLAEIEQELDAGTILGGKNSGKELTEEAIQQRKEWIAKYKEATKRFLDLEFV